MLNYNCNLIFVVLKCLGIVNIYRRDDFRELGSFLKLV